MRFLNKRHLDRTHAFHERHGGETIIIARFVPIVRPFAPLVAGIGSMTCGRFLTYNVVGAVLWVSIVVGGGYLFENLPFVEDDFSIIIVVLVLISVMPAVAEYLHQRLGGRGVGAASDDAAQPPAERGEEA